MKKLLLATCAAISISPAISMASTTSHPYSIKFYNNTDQIVQVESGSGSSNIMNNPACSGSNFASRVCYSVSQPIFQIKPHSYKVVTVTSNYTNKDNNNPPLINGYIEFKLEDMNGKATNQANVGIMLTHVAVVPQSSPNTGSLTSAYISPDKIDQSQFITSIIQTISNNSSLPNIKTTTVIYSDNPLFNKKS